MTETLPSKRLLSHPIVIVSSGEHHHQKLADDVVYLPGPGLFGPGCLHRAEKHYNPERSSILLKKSINRHYLT